MSDTSTLIAIKYKGQMIELPKDSSVSWNDLTDKPTTKTFLGVDIYENNIDTDFPAAKINLTNGAQPLSVYIKNSRLDFVANPGSVYYNGTYTDKSGNIQHLTDDQKQYVAIVCYKSGVYRTSIILKLNDNYTADIIKFESLDISSISVVLHAYAAPGGSGSIQVRITPTFNEGYDVNTIYQEISDGYWQVVAIKNVYSEVFLPEYIDSYTKTEADNKFALDTSVSQLWDSSMSGGSSTDLSDYYTKTQIDTSIANNYASKNDVSAFITSNDISTFVTDNDVSTFITANDISTKLEANDVSQFITSNDISTFITANDVSIYSTNTYVNSTFAKISYISQSDYDNLQVKDPSTLYIIPS